jgi:regulator of cell morphogenesis and NO signaling
MTIVTPEIPVGRMVAEQPRRARLFDRLGIDYCCGGSAPLAWICREKGLDPGDVMRQLAAFDAEGPDDGHDRFDAAGATLVELIDHIVAAHHAYLTRELPRLAAMAREVTAAHGERHAELQELRTVFDSLREELTFHMLKEDKVLFPIIARLEAATEMPQFHCGSVAIPIVAMEHEHNDAGDALARLRALSGGYSPPADACATYRALLDGLAELEADLRRHIHEENNILFPRARAAESALRSGAAESALRSGAADPD